MISGMTDKVCSLYESTASTCETNELYARANSKGVPLEANGGDHTLPSRRGLPNGLGRSTFEKNTQWSPYTTNAQQRTA